MTKISDLLGMNTRNLQYLKLNKKLGRAFADSKLLTKNLLKKYHIPHPRLIQLLSSYKDLQDFNWDKLIEFPNGFVIKPSEGLGGEGILVIKKYVQTSKSWLTADGNLATIEDFKVHIGNILEGQFSRNRTPDQSFIEERITIHPKFSKYTFRGTPDVRVIVFNSTPVMAMLRLPTQESSGKANLHQGGVGVGIDTATGITTYGVHHDSLIDYLPYTKRKLNGLVIPYWDEILKISVDAQVASKLGYVGVDLILDKDRGPLVIELNDQPGLQIQIANRAGLYGRLKRIENLTFTGKYKGIEVAKLLFAESFSDKVKVSQGRQILGVNEKIFIYDHNGKKHEVVARMDTGAYNLSIDRKLADDLGLIKPENILYESMVESASGPQLRPVIEVDFLLKGQKIKALAFISNRSKLKTPVLVGRRYLQSFFIDPSKK